MIPEEAKKKHRLTQEDCDTARLLLARQRRLKEIADLLGVDPSTVGKIRVANYDLPTYLAQRKEMNRKTKEKKRAKIDMMNHHGPLGYADTMIIGQMEMELDRRNGGDGSVVPQERNEQNRPLVPETAPAEDAARDETKLMRFQAAMMDRLIRKMDELIGVLKGGAAHE